MNEKVDLSIIIVSWNVKELLKKCLGSIYNNQGDLKLEIFVVDNASKDGSIEEIEKLSQPEAGQPLAENKEIKDLNLKIIKNKKNLGFTKANNQAIKRAQGEFILLLNPDAEVINGALEKMVEFMREHKKCGVAGCKLLNSDESLQPSVRRFPTFWSQAMIMLKLHHLFPNAGPIKKYFAKDFDYRGMGQGTHTYPCDQVMGAFFMIRREVIEKIGMLDENFFIWFEEVDFCKRVKDAGWQVCYTPEAEIIHHGAQSFKQVLSFKKQRMFNRSLLYYFKKHKPWWQWLGLMLLQPISLGLSVIIQIFAKKSNKVIE
ncbi:glycosyltransferase family 2 protein [Patescibacteria group bacterium]|nr:glycosyltransferase family 2 protein [Patescibacteria group bacterium]MBU4512911.1 glycosyltransferase family 2 protein [Patescibacteria group bacterium]